MLRVNQEIKQNLLDLSLVGFDHRRGHRHKSINDHAFVKRAAADFQDIEQRLLEVNRSERELALARQCQQLLDHAGGAGGGTFRDGGELLDFPDCRWTVFQVVIHHGDGTLDTAENVVEIMGQAACERTHGFHFLGLHKLFAFFNQLGNVFQNDNRPRIFTCRQRIDGNIKIKLMLLDDAFTVKLQEFSGVRGFLNLSPVIIQERRDVPERAANGECRFDTGILLHRSVPLGNNAFFIDGGQQQFDGVQHLIKIIAGGAQFTFNPFAGGQIVEYQQIPVADQLMTHFNLQHFAALAGNFECLAAEPVAGYMADPQADYLFPVVFIRHGQIEPVVKSRHVFFRIAEHPAEHIVH